MPTSRSKIVEATCFQYFFTTRLANSQTLITVNNATFFVRIDSEGIQFYLNLMQFVTSSYLDKQLHPEERIYRIWFVVFSVRLWRYWICCDKMYTLSENFVTFNCYLSAEINAHCFVLAYS